VNGFPFLFTIVLLKEKKLVKDNIDYPRIGLRLKTYLKEGFHLVGYNAIIFISRRSCDMFRIHEQFLSLLNN
jgi:hypothetical protein